MQSDQFCCCLVLGGLGRCCLWVQTRKIYFGDLTCNIVNILIVNDIIFINLKVAKDQILTVPNTKKKYLCDAIEALDNATAVIIQYVNVST